MFYYSLKDAASVGRATNQELEAWLIAVDKSGLPGKYSLAPLGLWGLDLYHGEFWEEDQQVAGTPLEPEQHHHLWV